MQRLDSYAQVEQQTDIANLVTQHAPLIKTIALRIKANLPAHVELDDLIQSGLIGLLEAHSSYAQNKGASFKTYATIKIRGAIIDELRKNSGITRDIGQNMKKIAAATAKLEHESSQEAARVTGKMVAKEMGISLEKLNQMSTEINAYQSLNWSDHEVIETVPDHDGADPFNLVAEHHQHDLINQMIQSLPEREQLILALYYNEQLGFKEIGHVLNLTEARISQLHQQIMMKLQQKCKP